MATHPSLIPITAQWHQRWSHWDSWVLRHLDWLWRGWIAWTIAINVAITSIIVVQHLRAAQALQQQTQSQETALHLTRLQLASLERLAATKKLPSDDFLHTAPEGEPLSDHPTLAALGWLLLAYSLEVASHSEAQGLLTLVAHGDATAISSFLHSPLLTALPLRLASLNIKRLNGSDFLESQWVFQVL